MAAPAADAIFAGLQLVGMAMVASQDGNPVVVAPMLGVYIGSAI